MPSRRINQRIIEQLEGLTAEQRQEVLEFLADLAPPAAADVKSSPRVSQRVRRRKPPGAVFWDRLVNEGLYDGNRPEQDG